ncbi:MAG: transcriptional regulator [Thermoprotei archaeon]|nr:MAG: transcriptional regulator [Thermoprotei archaeon]
MKRWDLKEMVRVLKVLSVELRLQILVLLSERPRYAYELARELGISYPLVHLHLRALERAGLIVSEYEVAEGGKLRRYYRVRDFRIEISPESLRSMRGGNDEE